MTETRTVSSSPPAMQLKREGSGREQSEELSSTKGIAHTLTACCRCRQRKTRCDPGLPRCTPCERNNAHCEYFDQTKRVRIPRHYVVHLQHKVRELEKTLEGLEREDYEPDQDDMVRGGASIKIQEHDESKFLGPSSGIAITRLVMQLAKQFTDSKSITDIVDQSKAQEIKERFEEEEVKPTSKIYPLISDVAAEDLPARDLTNLLVKLFNAKVMVMYPFFHEPTFWQDVDEVYNGSTDDFQNFAVRIVIAISLQRMDTKFAGLADSFYLAALRYLEGAVKPMNVKTIQCFCLIGAYSLLTPTRTAVYYVIGLAVRLAQALGLAEEKTIIQGANGRPANPLEIDMRRRMFWCVMVMEWGLAHSMGRASCLATALDHIDVEWFQVVDDQYITKDGIDPQAPRSLKKWICIHFYKMRLLQLEIRRKLYQKKRAEPKDDTYPWFHEMEEKLIKWRDAIPDTDAGSGLDKAWFVGRYNTMVVFMFRPSPQCPRPSLNAARRCFPACKSNIYMHRDQIKHGNVDMTWVFTQAMFMTINTILWTLSYEPIRSEHPRSEVLEDLEVALECIRVASERWPGVASALELYNTLIAACMRIYDKDGDVLISAASPTETISYSEGSRSRTTSPATQGFAPPPPKPFTREPTTPSESNPPPFGSMDSLSYSVSPRTTTTNLTEPNTTAAQQPQLPAVTQTGLFHTPAVAPAQPNGGFGIDTRAAQAATFDQSFDTSTQFSLPNAYPEFSWNTSFDFSNTSPSVTIPALSPFDPPSSNGYGISPNNVPYSDYLYPPSWDMEQTAIGLNQEQQTELMQTLEATGTPVIEHMIDATNAVFYPPNRRM